jgi:TRAP-type mannitol/chloroaromatic compound transport system substrate-binding protein
MPCNPNGGASAHGGRTFQKINQCFLRNASVAATGAVAAGVPIMKRRQFLQAAGVGLAATAVSKPAIAQSMPELRWRLTSSFPKSLDTLYGGSEVFAKAVAEATDNKFQVEVFAAGEIVPALTALDAVQSGTIEMCHTASQYYVGKDPTFTFATTVPFGPNARMQNSWWFFGGGAELMNDFYKKYNVYAIVAGNTGAQMGGWFRKEVRETADLQGLKFRVAGFAGTILARLGVVAQQIAAGDVYPALEKGTIDAAEWVGPYDDEKLGLQKIAPYYYYPGWWEGQAMTHYYFNLGKWNALTPSYQSILRSAASRSNEWMLAKYDAVNPPALRRLLAGGTKLSAFSPAIMDACLKAALEVYAEISAKNADFKRMWESVLGFRNEQYLWWQVAEYSYDSYLIRTRTRT